MKQTKTLIILVALLAVLGIGYLAVSSLTPEDTVTDTAETGDTAITLTDFDYATVKCMEYTAGGEHYLLEKINTVWYWAEDHALPLNQQAVLQMANAAGTLSALRSIEGSATEESYGLSIPSHDVTITLEDGSTVKFAIGNYNSFAGGYYLAFEGTVYIVSQDVVAYFSFAPIDMIKPDNLPVIADLTAIKSVLLDGEEHTSSMMLSSFYDAYSALSAGVLADYNAEAAELAEYGLEETARTTVTVNYTEKIEVTDTNQSISSSITKDHTLNLYIGATMEGVTFFSFDDSAMVYATSEATMQALLDTIIG